MVTGFGVNDALVLGGKPEMLKLTTELPPFTAPRLTVTLLLEPRTTVRDKAEREIVKSVGTLTVTVVVCVPLGPVPVMASVYVPGGVLAAVATVNVELVEPPEGGVTEAGLNVQVAFVGQPVTERPTELLKPFSEVTVTVELPDWPGVSVSDVGLAEIEKSGVAGPQPLNLNDPIRVYQP